MKDRKEAARAEARLGEVSALARCINRRGFDTRPDLALAPDATVEQVKEKVFDTDSERRIDMASFRADASPGDGDVKFDLHPRWDRSGRLVCVDTTRAGVRQCVIVDAGAVLDAG